ncbi:MAG TPA: hypothetical protein VJY64_02395, partial [Candidatus Onthovivens sp.]|nr:hypothetical protein [Candidatus Onthovivens sp.]
GFKKRIKLVFSLFALILPLMAYTGYCAYSVLYDRFDTLEEYKQDGMSSRDQAIHDALPTKESDPNAYYTDIKIGSQIVKISNISPSTNSYNVEMHLWFDFDQLDFHKTFYQKVYGEAIDEEKLSLEDNYTYHSESGTFTKMAYNVPDCIQLDDLNETDVNKMKVSPMYLEEVSLYPGETSSNNYPDKETMFIVGNGSVDADSFSYEMFEPYTLTDLKDPSIKEFRLFQKMSFSTTIRKSFDNPRYPLDSVQFHIYILPMMLTTEYGRYVNTPEIGLTKNYWASRGKAISIDENIYESGVSPHIAITSGYKLIKSDNVKGFVERLSYFKDNDQQELYRTEYEILIRCNRVGINLFLQAFVNLFSVVIWIVIAFYNQSYNGENSIGMLGTGLFGAISSILVGLSMISDAGMFSLITMINIFTLAVIMFMTYLSISAQRAIVKKDHAMIAYNGIKLRILFIVLTAYTLMMFIGLTLSAYIFHF